MKDLVLETLLDHARGRLAVAESGKGRLPRVIVRDPIYLVVDDIGGNFHAHVLARFVDVSEFGFHLLRRLLVERSTFHLRHPRSTLASVDKSPVYALALRTPRACIRNSACTP